ncbi:MAG: zinc ribbon domain-containing protein [Oscillospiraceae bacterium]
MERHCPACGARISDNMKICGNCGKILPPRRTNPGGCAASGKPRPSASSDYVRDTKQRPQGSSKSVSKSNAQKRPVTSKVGEKNTGNKPLSRNKKSSGRSDRKSRIIKWIKIAVIIFAIYAVISFAQVLRVKFSTYEFKTTDMKMSRDNYGQAIDGFFESGHWVYNPFTFTVKYYGESEGKDYELKFSAFTSVDVKEIVIDGEVKDEKQTEPIIMGMFI